MPTLPKHIRDQIVEIGEAVRDLLDDVEALDRPQPSPEELAAQHRANAAKACGIILAWLDDHPGVAERLRPGERLFSSDAVFETSPPDDFMNNVTGLALWTEAKSGVIEWHPTSVEAILARPLPDPPQPFDRTFGGRLLPA